MFKPKELRMKKQFHDWICELTALKGYCVAKDIIWQNYNTLVDYLEAQGYK